LDDQSEAARQIGYQAAPRQFPRCAYAAEVGVELTIEPINRYETNF
jgi:hypothetical protein